MGGKSLYLLLKKRISFLQPSPHLFLPQPSSNNPSPHLFLPQPVVHHPEHVFFSDHVLFYKNGTTCTASPLITWTINIPLTWPINHRGPLIDATKILCGKKSGAFTGHIIWSLSDLIGVFPASYTNAIKLRAAQSPPSSSSIQYIKGPRTCWEPQVVRVIQPP